MPDAKDASVRAAYFYDVAFLDRPSVDGCDGAGEDPRVKTPERLLLSGLEI
jgi:hypothetical protein